MPAEDSVELMILTIGTTYSLIFPILSNSIKHLTFNKSLLGRGGCLWPPKTALVQPLVQRRPQILTWTYLQLPEVRPLKLSAGAPAPPPPRVRKTGFYLFEEILQFYNSYLQNQSRALNNHELKVVYAE